MSSDSVDVRVVDSGSVLTGYCSAGGGSDGNPIVVSGAFMSDGSGVAGDGVYVDYERASCAGSVECVVPAVVTA